MIHPQNQIFLCKIFFTIFTIIIIATPTPIPGKLLKVMRLCSPLLSKGHQAANNKAYGKPHVKKSDRLDSKTRSVHS